MADLTNDIQKINDIEVAANKPVSENLFTRIGGSLNGLIDRRFPLDIEIFTSSGTWTCPTGVTKVIAIGIGGGGGGGEASGTSGALGDTGTAGNPTTFNGSTVANGGVGGEGGQQISGDEYPGRGRGGAQSGRDARGGTFPSPQGAGAPGLLGLNGGVGAGAGGNGGGGNSTGGAGGGAGQIGIREFTVVPATNYSYVVGTGGPGGSGGAGANGSTGSAGALCLLYTRITDV